MAPEELDRGGNRVAAVLAGKRMGGQVLRVGHRHRRAEARGEPRGIADVIGVAVRGDDATDCMPPQRRREMPFP